MAVNKPKGDNARKSAVKSVSAREPADQDHDQAIRSVARSWR